jgi:AmmeMemoRadiSam system protein B/AmmeMemoRadiSam system protein A
MTARLRPGEIARRGGLVLLLGLSGLMVLGGPLRTAAAATGNQERPPAVAGKFYPADSTRLEASVQAFLEEAVPPCGERPLAIVAPHAGYVFSGQTCADAYRQASDFDYEVVVILGTNHTQPGFADVSVYDGRGYRTPLGLAEIDRQTTAALLKTDPRFAFRPAVHKREHSVEVQVPFVQTVFPGVKIVAAVIGSPDQEVCSRFGRALASVLQGRRALIIASSDLSHYPVYEDAVAADCAVLEAIAGLDPDQLQATIGRQMRQGRAGLSTCACGEAPILTALFAARNLGATRGIVVCYTNSGDAALGERSRVVGYGAVVLSAGSAGKDVQVLQRATGAASQVGTVLASASLAQTHEQAKSRSDQTGAPGGIGSVDRRALLGFARETIRRYLLTETTPLARGFSSDLYRKQGAFVTLKKNGELRGCIGHMTEDMPLCQVVGAMALQAAFNDRRFDSLRYDELREIEIEVSVLSPFRQVSGPEAIVLGRDGVMLRKGGRSAVFLPQVPVEQGWDLYQMLDRLCLKAGLARGDWRQGVELHTFEAEVFHEADYQ